MKKIKIVVLAMCCCFFISNGKVIAYSLNFQNQPTLSVSWQPLENNYLGKEQALSVLEIRNNSQTFFPASGWKLYFNFIRIITPKSADPELNIQHVNGDWFYFTPTSDFKGLKPGECLRYELISNSWLVNVSDAPQGFYIVWDNQSKIEPLNQVAILEPTDAKKFYRVGGDKETSPTMLYEQNKLIKELPSDKLVKILPTPVFYQETEGAFSLNSKTKINFDTGFENEARLLNSALSNLLGTNLKYKSGHIKNQIRLVKNNLKDEAYELTVTSNNITISAGTPSGIFYGIQSLKTLLDPTLISEKGNRSTLVQCVSVKDEPRFPHRGMMLDVARNFQTKAQIKKVIDLMALYKMNKLHFHLNDDEGWRLEIPKLPELTEVGGKRAHIAEEPANTLPPSYGSGPFADQSSGSGYYSKADFIEILRYASERHIDVIPEIETPGHARAAIRAMGVRYRNLLKQGKKEEAEKYLLQDLNDQSVYRSVQKWNDNVMDVAMPSVYAFLQVVVDEVAQMYKEANAPLETIHFGGDEVPAGVWENSPAFKALKLKNPEIKNAEDLWDYYFDKVYTMLDKKGLYLSGWEEVGLRKITEDGKKRWVSNEKFKGRNIHLNVWNIF